MCVHRMMSWFLVAVAAASAQAQTTRPFSAVEAQLMGNLRTNADEQARIAAARQIGQFQDDRFLDVLCEALTDPSIDLRMAAVKAIGNMGTAMSVYQLASIAAASAQELAVRCRACAGIGEIARKRGDQASFSCLASLSRTDDSPRMSKMASDELASAVKGTGADACGGSQGPRPTPSGRSPPRNRPGAGVRRMLHAPMPARQRPIRRDSPSPT